LKRQTTKDYLVLTGLLFNLGCALLITKVFFSAALTNDYAIVSVNHYGERNIEMVLVPIYLIIGIYSTIILFKDVMKR